MDHLLSSLFGKKEGRSAPPETGGHEAGLPWQGVVRISKSSVRHLHQFFIFLVRVDTLTPPVRMEKPSQPLYSWGILRAGHISSERCTTARRGHAPCVFRSARRPTSDSCAR